MLTTAVIGLGTRGAAHAAALRAQPLSSLVGVCDSDPARRDPVAAACRVPGFAELGPLLELRPQLVSVGRDDPAAIRACLQAGAHVLCSPQAASGPSGEELAALAASRGLVLAADFNHRFVPGATTAREWVRSGRLGVPLFANLSLWGPGEGEPDPRACLRTLGLHAVDLLRYLCGEPAQVQCFAARGGTANVSLRLADGLVAHLNLSQGMSHLHPAARAEVAGNLARLVLDNVYEELTLYPHAEPETTVITNNIWTGLLGYQETYRLRLQRLLEQLAAGIAPAQVEGTAAEAQAARRVVEAAISALESGAVVKIA